MRLNSEGVPPPDDPHREAFFILPMHLSKRKRIKRKQISRNKDRHDRMTDEQKEPFFAAAQKQAKERAKRFLTVKKAKYD